MLKENVIFYCALVLFPGSPLEMTRGPAGRYVLSTTLSCSYRAVDGVLILKRPRCKSKIRCTLQGCSHQTSSDMLARGRGSMQSASKFCGLKPYVFPEHAPRAQSLLISPRTQACSARAVHAHASDLNMHHRPARSSSQDWGLCMTSDANCAQPPLRTSGCL